MYGTLARCFSPARGRSRAHIAALRKPLWKVPTETAYGGRRKIVSSYCSFTGYFDPIGRVCDPLKTRIKIVMYMIIFTIVSVIKKAKRVDKKVAPASCNGAGFRRRGSTASQTDGVRSIISVYGAVWETSVWIFKRVKLRMDFIFLKTRG